MACYEKWSTEFSCYFSGRLRSSALGFEVQRGRCLGETPSGRRPLFYHSDGKRVVWSSEIGALVSVLLSGMALDEEYLASFLVSEADPTRSPYKGISPVPPGSIVLLRKRAFPSTEILESPTQTAPFDTAVIARMRNIFGSCFTKLFALDREGPMGQCGQAAERRFSIHTLSPAMAEEIVGDKKAGAQDLETVSYAFDEASTCDERVFILSVEAKGGRGGFHIREDDYPAFPSFQ